MPITHSGPKKPSASRFRGVLKVMLFSAALVPLSAFSQQSMTLQQAIGKTLAQHPELKAYRFMDDAAQGYIQQAGVGTPLKVTLGVEDALGTGDASGISGMETTLGLIWLLEQKQLDSRVGVETQKAKLTAIEQQAKALDLAAETANIFIRLLTQKEQLQLAKLAQYQAQKSLEEITQRVAVGKVNVIDQLRAKADLSKKALVVEDLLHEIEASYAQLAAQWGQQLGEAHQEQAPHAQEQHLQASHIHKGDFQESTVEQGQAQYGEQEHGEFAVVGDLKRIPTIEQLDVAYEKLKSNPNIRHFATQRRVAESEIALARVSANPAWQINAGLRRSEANDDFGFVAGIAIPFGGENRNQGKIRALQAKQSQQQADAEALFQRISTQILLLTHQLKHNRHVAEGLSTETIPALDEAQQRATKAYRVGNYSYTDLYAIQQELLEAQGELIEAYANMQFINIELERLTGASIPQ